MSFKSFIVLGLVGTMAILVMGQDVDLTTNPGILMTVEGSYLQESVDLMIIRQQSRAADREMKIHALENIRSAMDKGITGGEVLGALEYMALEGIVNKAINDRIRNNYPDIRGQAAVYLGNLGNPEARKILVKMLQAEYEPMVLIEVVKSLTKIGINDHNNEMVYLITKRVNAFDVLVPDNLLALAALEAYEAFAAQSGGTLDTSTIQLIQRISEGRYHGAIRERAKQLLTKIYTYSSNPVLQDPSG
jgi:plasmid stability protein